MIDAEEAQARLQAIFDALDPAQRPAMVAALAEFVEQNGGGGGDPDVDQTNGGADRGFRGGGRGRSARDNLTPAALDAQIRTRRRDVAGFNKRWGNLTGNIEIWG